MHRLAQQTSPADVQTDGPRNHYLAPFRRGPLLSQNDGQTESPLLSMVETPFIAFYLKRGKIVWVVIQIIEKTTNWWDLAKRGVAQSSQTLKRSEAPTGK